MNKSKFNAFVKINILDEHFRIGYFNEFIG